MFFPIKFYTTEDSFLIIKLSIPLWLTVKTGFEPDSVIKDRLFAPNITIMSGKEKECLHIYAIGARLRIRSNKTMITMTDPNRKRILFGFDKGWSQLFDFAVL